MGYRGVQGRERRIGEVGFIVGCARVKGVSGMHVFHHEWWEMQAWGGVRDA